MPQMVLHPTDFSSASLVAFAHALRFALDGRGLLSILHVEDEPGGDPDWDQYPQVRETLQAWGLLPKGSDRGSVAQQLGLSVEKVVGFGNVGRAVAGYVEKRPMDLVVLATGGREGVPRWVAPSVAEPVVRNTGLPALFVHEDGRPLVHPDDGSVRLEHVLIAVAEEPEPHRGIATALHLLRDLGDADAPVQVHLLHVGDADTAPEIDLPVDGRWRSEMLVRAGDPASVICAVAEELSADLVVVLTGGAHGFVDALRGSTSEVVVRRSRCPVLAVPAEF